MNNVRVYLPAPQSAVAEVIAVLIGTLGAAFIISKFPKLKTFVIDNSVTVRDGGGPFVENG